MSTPSAPTNWPLILLLWVAGLGAAAQYGKVSVVFDRLGEMYPQAGGALGWAVSLVGAVGIVMGIVAGIVVAGLTLRRAILWGLWLGAAVSVLQGLSLPFWAFLATRLVEGLSHLAIVVAAPTLIAGHSNTRDQGIALTLWGTFFGVAFALLVWLGLPLADRFGVPALFLAHGLYLAACAVALSRVLPSETTGRPARLTLAGIAARHLTIYRSPWLGAPAAGWLFYTFCFVSLLTLLPPYLEPAQRAPLIAAIPLVSILSSLTLGVWLLRSQTPVRVVMIGFGSAALCAVALAFWQGNAALCLLLAALLGLIQGASFAAVPSLNELPENQALANGAMAQTGNIGNTLGTPVLFFVSSSLGYSAMLVGLALALICGGLVHLFLAQRRQGAQAP